MYTYTYMGSYIQDCCLQTVIIPVKHENQNILYALDNYPIYRIVYKEVLGYKYEGMNPYIPKTIQKIVCKHCDFYDINMAIKAYGVLLSFEYHKDYRGLDSICLEIDNSSIVDNEYTLYGII